MEVLLLIAIVVGGGVFVASKMGSNNNKKQEEAKFADAQADARRWIERLGSQVLTIAGTDAASTQAIADASERYTAASSQISSATTPRQAELARESALEGLHYMNAAREIMGMTAGPELPPLEGQRNAGRVTEKRTIEQEGRQITASPSQQMKLRTTTLAVTLRVAQSLLVGTPSLGGQAHCVPVCGLQVRS